MLLIMLIVMFVYGALVFFTASMSYRYQVLKEMKGLQKIQRTHQSLAEQQGNLFYERHKLETEAMQVFTLYEMTKDITRNFNEQDAFETFLVKLKEHVHYEECSFWDAASEQLEELKSKAEYFLFPLKEKRKLLGYLAIKGIQLEDKDKIVILSHQFTLALQRIRLYQEVEKLSITDSLTDVFTRRHIMERLEGEIRRSKTKKLKLSFLMIDVDHFKRFNDRYGHLIGDAILCGISNILVDTLREIDVIGRYGGEEFCIILPETDREGSRYVAERIRSSLEKTSIQAYDAVIKATVSIGVATFPDDGESIEELIDKADWALYRAKKNGRNTICCFGIYN